MVGEVGRVVVNHEHRQPVAQVEQETYRRGDHRVGRQGVDIGDHVHACEGGVCHHDTGSSFCARASSVSKYCTASGPSASACARRIGCPLSTLASTSARAACYSAS